MASYEDIIEVAKIMNSVKIVETREEVLKNVSAISMKKLRDNAPKRRKGNR